MDKTNFCDEMITINNNLNIRVQSNVFQSNVITYIAVSEDKGELYTVEEKSKDECN